MAKQIIRHLEYYGFPDQNAFRNDIDCCHHHCHDDKQDHAIHELFNRTHMLKDWNVKQENDIKELTNEYNNIAETIIEQGANINTISGDVENIKIAIGELPFPSIAEQMSELDNKIETNHTEFLDYSAATTHYLNEFKDETYTKNEVDNLITDGLNGYATEEWVKNQQYLTEESGNSIFVRQDIFVDTQAEINSIENRVDTLETSARTSYNSIHILDEKVNEYHTQVENYIDDTDALRDRVQLVEGRIGVAEARLDGIDATVDLKSDKVYVDNEAARLDGRIDALSSSTDVKLSALDNKKVDKEEYNSFTSSTRVTVEQINNAIHSLEANKATTGDIASLTVQLNSEISNRISSDEGLQNQINNINTVTIPSINDRITVTNSEVSRVEGKIDQEILDRQASDTALIGNASDAATANTINGAKKYATEQRQAAVNESTTYTNNKIADFRNVDFVAFQTTVNSELATKASSGDLDALGSGLRSEYSTADNLLRNELVTAIEAEGNLRNSKDNELQREIESNNNDITEAYNKINALENELSVVHGALHDLLNALKQTGVTLPLPSDFHPEI